MLAHLADSADSKGTAHTMRARARVRANLLDYVKEFQGGNGCATKWPKSNWSDQLFHLYEKSTLAASNLQIVGLWSI
jgi:hypothetical protein